MGIKQPTTGLFRSREGIRLLTVAIVFLLVGSIASFVTARIAFNDAQSASSNAVSQAQEIKASNICRDHPEEPLCINAQKIIDNPTNVVQGPAGRPGTNGIDGKDGTDGTNGLEGIPGLQGLQGIQGEPGPAGQPGPAGTNGTNGISITSVACDTANNWQITFSSGDIQTVSGPCRVIAETTPVPTPTP